MCKDYTPFVQDTGDDKSLKLFGIWGLGDWTIEFRM